MYVHNRAVGSRFRQGPTRVLCGHAECTSGLAPACAALKLPRATWLTFRRTYSSWAHDKGVPDKITAELMGHANVYTTLNVYTQAVTDSKKAAAQRIGNELFSIVQFSGVADAKGGIDSSPKASQTNEVVVNAGS